MMEMAKNKSMDFPFSIFEAYMKRAGISSGYQTKPCLDPTNPDCPKTAPNKQSQQVFSKYIRILFRTIYSLSSELKKKNSFVPAEKVTKHLFFRSWGNLALRNRQGTHLRPRHASL